MFVTFEQHQAPIQFSTDFKIWRAVDLLRLVPIFVVRIVELPDGEDRTALVASDEDLDSFLSAIPDGWELDSVALLIPPETLDPSLEWRSVRVTEIGRPLDPDQRVVHPLVLTLADQGQLAGQPLSLVDYPASTLESLQTFEPTISSPTCWPQR